MSAGTVRLSSTFEPGGNSLGVANETIADQHERMLVILRPDPYE